MGPSALFAVCTESAAVVDREPAGLWVKRLHDMAGKDPSLLVVVVVADMAKSELPLSSCFVAEFTKRLSRQDQVLHLARDPRAFVKLERGTKSAGRWRGLSMTKVVPEAGIEPATKGL